MKPPVKNLLPRIDTKKILPLLIILLLNLVLLIILGSVVMVHTVMETFEVQAAKIQVTPPQPPTPPVEESSASNLAPNAIDPEPQVVPPPAAVNTIKSISPLVIKMNTADLASSSLNKINLPISSPVTVPGDSGDSANKVGPGDTIFGTSSNNGPTLLKGYFYDFKQTRARTATNITYAGWYKELVHFVSEGWNEKNFDAYFRSTTALSTGIFAISLRPSEEAPKAFNLEKEVKANLWAAYYLGKVSTAEAGDYRFVGYGDLIMAVAINNSLCFDGGLSPLSSDSSLHHTFPYPWTKHMSIDPQTGMEKNMSLLRLGNVFHMEANVPVKMQVLLGDEGGSCGFYLYLQKMDKSYQKQPDGTPILPFFRLTPTIPKMTGRYPDFSPSGPIWDAAQ